MCDNIKSGSVVAGSDYSAAVLSLCGGWYCDDSSASWEFKDSNGNVNETLPCYKLMYCDSFGKPMVQSGFSDTTFRAYLECYPCECVEGALQINEMYCPEVCNSLGYCSLGGFQPY
jgi:hypothetical protein